jgi:hypothetical protein
MSTPPPSYIDDGPSFRYRQPPTDHPPPASVASTSTSTYISNSSYVDPGPTLPPSFSTRRIRREDAPWNGEIARAVGGDMVRSLARLRNVASLHPRRSKDAKAKEGDGDNIEQLERERRDSKKGVVSVSVPGPWGVFVIKDEEGRVVVVDADGEYEGDGGADAAQVREGWGSRAARRRRDGGESWSNEGFDEELGMRLSRHDEREEQPEWGTDKSRSSRRRHRAKTPSLLTETESSTDKDFKPSSPTSPTRFLMTGARGGWPSRTPSPSFASPIVPHPYTWEGIIPSPPPSRPSSKLKTALQLFSRNNSLPGSWPTRTPSSRDTTTTSTASTSSATYSKPRSPISFHKTTTSHHTPDAVEVIYDETPPGELSHPHSQRSRSRSRSRSSSIKPPTSQHTQRSRRSQRSPIRHTTTTSPTLLLKNGSGWDDAPHEAGLRNLSHNSDAGWSSSSSFSVDFTGKESEDGAGSEAHSAATKPSVCIQNWSDNGSVMHGKPYREWDGFERLKTISEVSVAGGSIRTQHGWPGSVSSPSRSQSGKSPHKSSPATHSSSTHGHARSSSDATYPSTSHSKDSKHSTHRSSHSHHKRSSTHSPTGWSSFSLPQRSAPRSADGWSTTVTHNVKKDE